MAIVRRRAQREEEGPPGREWELDPFRVMREMLGLDPYRDLQRHLPTALGGVGFRPAFEVKERPDAYVFRADLPGLSEDDVEISFLGNRLTVSGRREVEDLHEGETFYACERAYGSFTRSFNLPEGADVEHATAELKDGVLLLAVPKKSDVKPRKITVTPGKQGQVKA